MIGRKKVRTPERPQFQTTECGVAVLRIMLAYFGKHVSAREVRRATGVSRDCLNAAEIRRAARSLGLTCKARSLDTSELASLQMPVVVHLRFIHFAVLEHIGPCSVRLNCPAAGMIEESLSEFDHSFTGMVLEVRPGPDFKHDHTARNAELRWWSKLCRASPFTTALAVVLIIVRAGCALLLARVLARGPSGLQVALALCGVVAAGLASSLCLDAARQRTYARLRADIVAKLTAVESAFYVYRIPAVVFDCISSADWLTNALFTRLAPAALALVEVIVLLGGIARFNSTIGIAFTVCFATWLGTVAVLTGWRRQVERNAQGTAAGNFVTVWNALKNAPGTKLGEGPDHLRLEMQGSEARSQLANIQTGNAPSLLPIAHYGLAAFCIAVVLSIQPAHTASLCTLATALAVAAIPLARMRGAVGMMRQDGAQIRDILDEPSQSERQATTNTPADGALVLDHVTFGFNPNKPPIIQHVSIAIESGEHVGLTGPSGGGKSTLTELMAGLHEPASGRVSIGGIPLDSIPAALRARTVALVGGRPLVFAASLRNNITLWDDSITVEDFESAIRDAELGEIISDLPDGLETQIESGGRNLSGGQLKRMEIARALTRNPRILILDNALDALDFPTEMRIREAIRLRGCTLIVVTHRTNSLSACDRVIHFPSGPTGGVTDSVTSLSIFGDTGAHAGPEQPVGLHAIALCKAFARAAGTASNVDPKSIAVLDRGQALAHLARSARLCVRPIRFMVDWWWGTDFGCALAFRRDGTPVALIQRWNGTRVFDPVTGLTHQLAADTEIFEPHAWTFSVEQERLPLSLGQCFRDLLAAVWPQAAFTCLLALAASICLLSALIPGPVSLRSSAVTTLSAFIGLILFATRSKVVSRTRVLLNSAQSRLVRALLTAADPDIERTWEPRQLFLGVCGLCGLGADILDWIDRGCGALLLLGVLLCGIARYSPGSATIVVSAAVAVSVIQAGIARLEMQRRRGAEVARFRAREHLSVVLNGARRLQSLNRFAFSLDRWVQHDCESGRFFSHCLQMKAVGISCRFALAFAPAVLVYLADPSVAPIVMGLSALAGVVSLSFGAFVASWGRGKMTRSAAAALLGLEHERGVEEVAVAAPIHISAVSCQYKNAKTVLFDQLSLDIDPRAITVLTGPSGAGKSTLLRLLLHLQRPQQGCIRLASTPVDQADMRSWRRGVAGVFQGDALDSTITVRGHLAANGISTLSEIWRALEFVELAEDVRNMPMGLQTIVGPETLSSGQQQRLLIARALLAHPVLLVLDEATNGIPERQQGRILARLRAAGIGCLIVSHRETVIRAADTVFVVDRGLLYSGPPKGFEKFSTTCFSYEEEMVVKIDSCTPEGQEKIKNNVRRQHPFRPAAVSAYERPLVRTIPLMVRPFDWKLWL